ncbi:MAG: cytochrome c biogenesis protein CcsA [Myxococcota bacterium]|nr:cytochrome c biogenesis protein CcsA [Myxococcota bacterium]
MTFALLFAASVAFLVASVLFTLWILRADSIRPASGTVAVVLGVVCLAGGIVMELQSPEPEALSVRVMMLVALGLVGLGLVPSGQRAAPMLQPALAALMGAVCLALALKLARGALPVATPGDMGAVTALHIGATLLGFVLFVPSYGLSVLYLNQEHRLKSRQLGSTWMPGLLKMEQVAWRLVLVGFPLYSIGILLGLVWQDQAPGPYGVRPAHVLAVVSWALYGVLSYRRLRSGWRGRRASLLAMGAFTVMLAAVLLYGMR